MEPTVTIPANPSPSLEQFEASAQKLPVERDLSKGGRMPSQQAVAILAKMMANRVERKLKEKQQTKV